MRIMPAVPVMTPSACVDAEITEAGQIALGKLLSYPNGG